MTLNPALLHLAIDAVRAHNDCSWRDVATEIGCSPSTLSRLQNGQKPNADALVAILAWLKMPISAFTVAGTPSTL